MNINPAAVSTWFRDDIYYKEFPNFMASSKKHGLAIHNADEGPWVFGNGREWYRKVLAQHRFVKEHPEFTHFMFTDSYDIFFVAGWEEITAKYLAYDSPIVFGTEACAWPKGEQAGLYPITPYRSKYLNAGFWMGERGAALNLLDEAAKRAETHTQCDSGIFVDLFLSGKYPIKLDNSCSILFCCNLDSLDYIERNSQGRPQCKDTGQTPCIFHGNGASKVCYIIQMVQANEPSTQH